MDAMTNRNIRSVRVKWVRVWTAECWTSLRVARFAGYQCDNSDFDICITEHSEIPVEKICSDEGRDDCQQLKPKGTEASFGTTVITVTILFIISILFSRVTVNVLVFVLRVVFFHCQGTSRAKMVDLRGGQQKYCSRPKNYRSCCEKCNVRCRFRGDFSGVRFHV